MTLKDLATEYRKQLVKKHPNVPAYAIPSKKFKENTANELTKTIVAFCEMRDLMVMRTGNEGRFRPGKNYVDVIGRARVMKGTWLPGQNNGQADLSITIKGKIHWVEVKIGKDRQSEDQKNFEQRVKNSGGVYIVVKCWEDFYNNFILWQK